MQPSLAGSATNCALPKLATPVSANALSSRALGTKKTACDASGCRSAAAQVAVAALLQDLGGSHDTPALVPVATTRTPAQVSVVRSGLKRQTACAGSLVRCSKEVSTGPTVRSIP